MYKKTIIKPNTYYDSVTLMSLGSKIKAVEGVKEAVVVMATGMNKEILMNVGLGNEETEGATQNDLIIAVEARDEETCVEAHRMILDKLTKGSGQAGQEAEVEYKTIRHAVKDNRAANVAVISVPGRYAAREAKIALNSGLHVMMFSDNVSIEEERELKELAVSKGLLMMGPDCGTAVINHTGLCFANEVRRRYHPGAGHRRPGFEPRDRRFDDAPRHPRLGKRAGHRDHCAGLQAAGAVGGGQDIRAA